MTTDTSYSGTNNFTAPVQMTVAGNANLSNYPYGQPKSGQTGAGERFATYYRDATGLEYAQNRYYSTTWGRFITPDPSMTAAVDMRNPGSWNIWAYASGDPTNLNDPEGLDACSKVKLEGWEGIPAGTTVGDFLNQNSDLSYFAITVFTESRIGWDGRAALEKAAIAAVIPELCTPLRPSLGG